MKLVSEATDPPIHDVPPPRNAYRWDHPDPTARYLNFQLQIQLIDRVSNEEELRDGEGQWTYRLNTLSPYGLNEDDFFFWLQNKRRDVDKIVQVHGNCQKRARLL